MSGARKCLLGITCGPQVTLNDVNRAVTKINSIAGNNIDLKVAINKNPALGDDMLISIIATDFVNSEEILSNNKPYQYNENDAKKLSEEKDKINSEDEKEKEEENIIPSFLNDDDTNINKDGSN